MLKICVHTSTSLIAMKSQIPRTGRHVQKHPCSVVTLYREGCGCPKRKKLRPQILA